MARYHNSEGYADTTAYIAEKNIEKKNKRYLRHGKARGYPVSGYRIGELYCFRLAVRKMGIRI